MNTRFLLGLLTVFTVALCTRAIALGSVNQVVFDEVHFGKFISSYCCTHERFFDIHPPIGKLIIAGGANIAGGTNGFSFDHIGQEYTGANIASIRLVPALFGALLPVIIMILLYQSGVSFMFSLLGGIAATLENAFIVESRFIVTDTILLTAQFGAIAAAIAAVQAKKEKLSWMFVVCAGVLSGVAVGTKFTGAIGGALAVLILLSPLLRGRRRGSGASVWLGKICLLVASAIAVYLIGWMLHFSLLTLPGSGDVWGVPTGIFLNDFIHTHQQMLSANYNLTAGHPYGSRWYTWPLMIRSVFYWQGENSQFIYFLGNPIVWWGSTVLFIGGLFYCIFTWKKTIPWVFVLGYIASYVPLLRVPRVLFLYHYLTPLIFSLLFGLWWLDSVVPHKKQAFFSILGIIILGFLFVSPLTYGFSLPQFWSALLFSISTWR